MPSIARYDAFLSYNSQDRLVVEELARRLRDQKLELFLEEWELAPGREFQPVLAEGLRDSKTCVVFLGPSGLGPWQKQELQVAIDKRARDTGFHVIPVLLPGSERPRRGEVAHLEFLINASWVEFLKTLDDEHAFQKLRWGITGQKPPALEEGKYAGQCPYRGLEVFRPEDAKFFFGRANLTDWLVSELRREIRAPQGVRFLAVLGPSGCGKSSVVLAGLIPRLKAAGAIEGGERCPVAILRPGDDPPKNLAAGVVSRFLPTGALPDAAQVLKLADDLRADARTLDVFAQVALHDRPEDVRLVVVVDQFEEVFTYRPEDDQAQARKRFEASRAAFFASLLNAAAAPAGRVAVVLTMRSDFLGACAPFPKLNGMLNAHLVQVGPMHEDELREAIEQPAYLVGCEPEPALTERLLADVKGQPGTLPLLQFTLKELWEKREVRKLRLDTYETMGGIEGALEHRANEIFRNFKHEEQDLCRRIFLRLVQPGEGTEDTKRRAPFRELLDSEGDTPSVEEVIRRLADARLITTEGRGRDEVRGEVDQRKPEGFIEVAHEALIRGWGQLRQWIDADRAGLLTHRRLTESARDWENNDRDPSYLFEGARLAIANEWAGAHRDDLNLLEAEFLVASLARQRQRKADELEAARRLAEEAEARRRAEEERALEAERREREAQAKAAQERKARRLTAALAASIIGMMLLFGGGWLRFASVREARIRRLQDAKLALDEAQQRRNEATKEDADPSGWEKAIAAAKRAVALLDDADDFSRRNAQVLLDELERDHLMIERLEEIRLEKIDKGLEQLKNQLSSKSYLSSKFNVNLKTVFVRIDSDYAKAFRDYGIDVKQLKPAEAAAHIRKRPVALQLVAALDDWAGTLRNLARERVSAGQGTGTGPAETTDWGRLIVIARDADPDRWRNRLRDAIGRKDQKFLDELAKTADINTLPIMSLLLLDSQIESESFLRRARQRHPEDFWLNIELAGKFINKVDFNILISIYNVGEKSSPGATVARDSSPLNEAIRYATAASSLRSKNSIIRLLNCGLLMANGSLDEAIVECHEVARLDPDLVISQTLLGALLAHKGDHEGAIAAFRRAFEKDNSNLSELVEFLIGQRELDKAEAACREALARSPGLAVAHGNLGWVLLKRGELDASVAASREALRLDPTLAWVQNNLGVALERKGRVDEAIAEYRRALELDPKHAKALNNLVSFLIGQRELDKAEAACREALARSPGLAVAHGNLGWVLLERGELDASVAASREALRLDPTLAWAQSNLGVALDAKAGSTRPSPFSARPSISTPRTPMPTTTSAGR